MHFLTKTFCMRLATCGIAIAMQVNAQAVEHPRASKQDPRSTIEIHSASALIETSGEPSILRSEKEKSRKSSAIPRASKQDPKRAIEIHSASAYGKIRRAFNHSVRREEKPQVLSDSSSKQQDPKSAIEIHSASALMERSGESLMIWSEKKKSRMESTLEYTGRRRTYSRRRAVIPGIIGGQRRRIPVYSPPRRRTATASAPPPPPPPPPPVNCKWGEWDEWSECDYSCGGGDRNRMREVEQEAENGGTQCDGPPEETQSCNEEECPTTTTMPAITTTALAAAGASDSGKKDPLKDPRVVGGGAGAFLLCCLGVYLYTRKKKKPGTSNEQLGEDGDEEEGY